MAKIDPTTANPEIVNATTRTPTRMRVVREGNGVGSSVERSTAGISECEEVGIEGSTAGRIRYVRMFAGSGVAGKVMQDGS